MLVELMTRGVLSRSICCAGKTMEEPEILMIGARMRGGGRGGRMTETLEGGVALMRRILISGGSEESFKKILLQNENSCIDIFRHF
jgi:hypothetical protein